jgi:transcription antitermination protein NusB
MANRRLSRSIVLQTLFEWDTGNRQADLAALNPRLEENANEFGASHADIPFMRELLKLVLAKYVEIDAIIVKAAPEWPLDKIALVDRNILRIGLVELLFSDRASVPAKVAINEAIELAKTFGSESSSKFINGVLGAVYVDIGEPGKEEQSKAKEDAKKPLPVEALIGAVVYAKEGDQFYLALVHDIFGHWTLTKGRLKPEETHGDGVQRKALEEMGLTVTVEDLLGENEYIANDPHVGRKKRHAHYYLAQSSFSDLSLKKEGGLDDAQWFPLAKVGDLNFYDDILPVITHAINILVAKHN